MGRGTGKFFHPSPDPTVTIGLTLNTSLPILYPNSPSPFFVTVSARILTSPHPASPITLCTHRNPLGNLHNRCFRNITCVFPNTEAPKHIEIWPRGWPHHIWNTANLRDGLPFVTLRPDELYEVKFEVEPAKIAAANLVTGEEYRVALTDKGLGTSWWTFGSLEDTQGLRYRRWGDEKSAEEDDEEWRYWEKVDGDDEEGQAEKGEYTMGEDPQKLALVVEKGEAIFEIG